MVVHSVTQSIESRKRVWDRKTRVLLEELGKDFVRGRRDLLEERVVDEFKEMVESNLVKVISYTKKKKREVLTVWVRTSLKAACLTTSESLLVLVISTNVCKAERVSSACSMNSDSLRLGIKSAIGESGGEGKDAMSINKEEDG